MLLYIVTKYLLIGYLPSKWFGDSNRLSDIANDAVEGRGSYAATAALFSLLPPTILNLVVVVIGSAFIIMAWRSAMSWLSAAIIFLLLLLSVPQTLLVPLKETIVVAMALSIVFFSRNMGDNARLVMILVVYMTYGLLVRNYYVLILLVWVALKMFRGAGPFLKISFVLVACAILLLMPVDIMQQMQGQRDASNKWALYVIYSDNRTAFFNPLPPDNILNFFVNYIYAVGVLNFPLIKFLSVKELLFTLVLFGCFAGVWKGFKMKGRERDLSLLFLSHILILCTFEPDLGSYFRHFTSVSCYLFPAFAFLGLPAKRMRVPRKSAVA